YDGMGSIALTANGTSPATLGLKANLKGVSLKPLLVDASDMDRLSGKADITLDANARGKSQLDIVQSLSGNGNFNVADGKIERVNLLNLVKNIAGAGNAGGTTEFSQMGGTFNITNGVINNNDLLIAMQGVRVNGEGNVNLPDYTINYRLSPQTFSTKQDAATGATVERAGVQVPVLISGSLDGPSFQPDLQATLKNALSDPKAFKEQLKNSRGDIKEQIKQQKDAIKGIGALFKKKKD
ncbi:MAG: AsmA family protein, partial [Rickettsiales bacterium]|nr:AsmA family protein [Rickettsiales bacterium]